MNRYYYLLLLLLLHELPTTIHSFSISISNKNTKNTNNYYCFTNNSSDRHSLKFILYSKKYKRTLVMMDTGMESTAASKFTSTKNNNDDGDDDIKNIINTLYGLLVDCIEKGEFLITSNHLVQALTILQSILPTGTSSTTNNNDRSTATTASTATNIDIINRTNTLERQFIETSILVANELCQIAMNGKNGSSSSIDINSIKNTNSKKQKKETWQLLQQTTDDLLIIQTSSLSFSNNYNNKSGSNEYHNEKELSNSAIAISFVYGALSLLANNDDGTKAVASALASSILRKKEFLNMSSSPSSSSSSSWYNFTRMIFKTFLVHATTSNSFNLNILTYFARGCQITSTKYTSSSNNEEEEAEYSLEALSAAAIRYSLHLMDNGEDDDDDDDVTTIMDVGDVNNNNVGNDDDGQNNKKETYEIKKQKVSNALALACQIGPWTYLSPTILVHLAIPFEFWHAAEQVCSCAYKDTQTPSSTTISTTSSKAQQQAKVRIQKAVEILIDAAFDTRSFRLADNIATKLYEQGGRTRYVEARLLHAYETISKIVVKGQIPMIERQVDRVDKAVEKVKNDNKVKIIIPDFVSEQQEQTVTIDNKNHGSNNILDGASMDIRNFCLTKLSEYDELSTAHRLATLWGMEYVYDEESMKSAAAAKREKYIQWDELFESTSTDIPELIFEPKTLVQKFEPFLMENNQNSNQRLLFGIDAEWDEDSAGVCIFQFASFTHQKVLLLDIPALLSTSEGIQGLANTLGTILDYDSANAVVVGFAPRQDISRLRSTPIETKHSQQQQHWLSGTKAVVDVQKIIGDKVPQLKTLGLSRMCEYFLGKALDKAEQCSYWSKRPLSQNQRIYAALDAYACCLIYSKLHSTATTSSTVVTTCDIQD